MIRRSSRDFRLDEFHHLSEASLDRVIAISFRPETQVQSEKKGERREPKCRPVNSEGEIKIGLQRTEEGFTWTIRKGKGEFRPLYF